MPGRARSRLAFCLIASLLLLPVATGAGRADSPERDVAPEVPSLEEGEAEEADEPEIEYTVEITGVEDDALAQLLNDVSTLVALAERPPATFAGLQRRAEGDRERFEAALRSEGYYASKATLTIDREAEPVALTIEVTPGELYLIADYTIVYVGSPEPRDGVPRQAEDLGLALGAPARAPEIVAADGRLLRLLAEAGYPLAEVVERKATVDHAVMSMTIAMQVDAGPLAAFGPVTIVGLEDVEEDYVRLILPWQEGDRYDQRAVDEARVQLSETQLFQSIVIQLAEAVDAEGRLPLTLELSEGDRRSVGGALTFSTDEGLGAGAFWQHRNVFGRNETLRLAARVAQIEQLVQLDLRKPRFRRPDQTLLGNATFKRSDNDAFEENTLSFSGAFERTFGGKRLETGDKTPLWRARGGLSAEFSRIDDNESDRNLQIYGVPLSLTRDGRDDPLNATRGTFFNVALTPFLTGGDTSIVFARAEANGSAYLSVHPEDKVILAARARLGSIAGPSTARLPATKRFYSGGGASVRGFTFKKIGPLDDDNDPLGGRSVLEIGGEARFRFFEDFGLVTFVDSGTVSDDPVMDFEERYLVAAGLGLRYFTGVGPLRFDIAFPINGRDTDDAFQFYISLGQAF